MHACLKLHGYPRLPLQVEEGLCQLMAFLFLQDVLAAPRPLLPDLVPPPPSPPSPRAPGDPASCARS
eukprot:scaffold1953_cov391-Prasinococcus_capsulatus_cf.AAC.2